MTNNEQAAFKAGQNGQNVDTSKCSAAERDRLLAAQKAGQQAAQKK